MTDIKDEENYIWTISQNALNISIFRHKSGPVAHAFNILLYVPPSHAAVKFPPHLQRAALGRVEDQEATQDSLAVSRHVEGHAIFPPQNTLSQLLNTTHIVT